MYSGGQWTVVDCRRLKTIDKCVVARTLGRQILIKLYENSYQPILGDDPDRHALIHE